MFSTPDTSQLSPQHIAMAGAPAPYLTQASGENKATVSRAQYLNIVDIVGSSLREDKTKFDIIVTNPPYIPSNDIKRLATEVKDYDPILALDGGNDGLDAYRSIIPCLKNLLKTDGKIFVEIGKGQKKAVSEIGSQHELFPIEFTKDLSNIIRVIVFNIK